MWAQQAYIKASNPDESDWFGSSVALDKDTLVVGSTEEASKAAGVNGDQRDNSVKHAGALYVFVRRGTTWTQQAYIKSPHPDVFDRFGSSIALDDDTLVAGAPLESSSARGLGGDSRDNTRLGSGAAYVFVRRGTLWTQEAYIKASNADREDNFSQVALQGDLLVASAAGEDSGASGVNGAQADNSVSGSGAVYVFVRSSAGWQQRAYLKAAYPGEGDSFGARVSLDRNTIAVGAPEEDGGSGGINGNQNDDSVKNSGAVYTYRFLP